AWFAVFDGPPTGDVSDATTYGTNTINLTGVMRDPDDPSAIRLTLAVPVSPGNVPHVRYMPPPGQLPQFAGQNPEVWTTIANGAVRGAESGLPLPTFGPLAAMWVP
nr:hypothetical protein [Trueperaceae bacterium]